MIVGCRFSFIYVFRWVSSVFIFFFWMWKLRFREIEFFVYYYIVSVWLSEVLGFGRLLEVYEFKLFI